MELSYQELIWNSLVAVSVNLFLLVVWFHTNAFVEYCKALSIGGLFFKIEDFEKENELTGVSYPEYLEINFPCFFTKLIACPYCVGSWLSIIGGVLFESIYVFFFSFYPLIFFFFLLSLIIKKNNEE